MDKAREALKDALDKLFMFSRFEVYVTACKVCATQGLSLRSCTTERRDGEDCRQKLASLTYIL